ncbi:MAG TPA: histidinol dehydrogenase, partial [Candidatus Caenarcaniphilales bacterium]|nr:histidinol dehydrogenase [Candidatus Caenarcaniphilales bacterium]
MTLPALLDPILARVDWSALDAGLRDKWLAELRPPEPAAEVTEILAAVRSGGDAALRELIERHDGARPEELWVTDEEFEAAEAAVTPTLVEALTASAAAVEKFHAAQLDILRSPRPVETRPGVRAWRRFAPLRRVGGYVPGGRAALASSVVMLGIPAALAAVDELILATP